MRKTINNKRYYTITHEDVLFDLPSVTSILGIISKGFAFENWLKKNALADINKKTDEACDIGTRTHSWIQGHIENKILIEPFKDNASMESFCDDDCEKPVNAFLEWERKNKVKWLYSELVIYDVVNGYAGTLDAIAELNGVRTLIDFKTSKGFYNTMGLQLSAYNNAGYMLVGSNDNLCIKGKYQDMLKAEKQGILRLDKVTGLPHYKEFDDEFEMFLTAKKLFDWNNKK